MNTLKVKRARWGGGCFSHLVPKLWNSMDLELRLIKNEQCFRKKLKKTQNVAVLLKTSLDVSPSLFSAGMSVGSHALYKSFKVS